VDNNYVRPHKLTVYIKENSNEIIAIIEQNSEGAIITYCLPELKKDLESMVKEGVNFYLLSRNIKLKPTDKFFMLALIEIFKGLGFPVRLERAKRN